MDFRDISDTFIMRRPGQKFSYLLAFSSLMLYLQLGYATDRTDTAILVLCYIGLFVLYLVLVRSVLSFGWLLFFGIAFRMVWLFAIPQLSDDFYRFFWDGLLTAQHINPFLYLPREIIENSALVLPGLDIDLFNNLNSPDYYTVYPPFSQAVFWLSVKLGVGQLREALFIMKVLILFADAGTVFFIIKLLKIHGLKKEYVLFYIFNPLIIIEFTGNVHFEAFMICFVLGSAYMLHRQKLVVSALLFALAIASKLTPLLLLPFFLRRLGFKKATLLYTLTILVTVITFLPFFGEALTQGMSSSIGLYFQKFEFNASIFYLVRAIGFWILGWDVIQMAGPIMGGVALLAILLFALFENTNRQNLPGVFLWPMLIYLAMASIVHPWYVTPLFAFSLFGKYRFAWVWTFVVFFTYTGYQTDGYQNRWWIIIAEYTIVFGMMIVEVYRHKDLLKTKKNLLSIH